MGVGDHGAFIFQAVQIGDLRLDPFGTTVSSGATHPTIELTKAMLTPASSNHSYYAFGSRAQKHQRITDQNSFEFGVYTTGINQDTEYNVINNVLDKDKLVDPEIPSVLASYGSQSLVPSPTNIIRAFLLPGHRLAPLGGAAGDATQYDYTTDVSSAYDELTAVIAQPANLVAANPTTTTIDLTWDADTEGLPAQGPTVKRVKFYDILISTTTGGPVGDPYVAATPATALANQLGNSVTVTGLTTATEYFFVVKARGFYNGDDSVISAEATDTTA